MDVRGEADHLDDHLVVGLDALGAGIADRDGLGEDLAVDLHHRHAGGFEIRADEPVGRPLDDVDDPPSTLPRRPTLLDEADAHGVAIGSVAGVFGGNEDIGVAPRGFERALGPHEAEAGLRAAERADDVLMITLVFS